MPAKETLVAHNLSKTFPKPDEHIVLKEISLTAHAGDTIAIMGPSGVGKTTLLHILGTLEKPTSGTLFIEGKKADKENGASLRNQHIGFIFQNFNLVRRSSVMVSAAFSTGDCCWQATVITITSRADSNLFINDKC